MGDWIAFWDSEHSIYVSTRHREMHAARLAADISAYIRDPTVRMLDYGCGEALYVDRLRVGHLTLIEAAPTVRAKLEARYAGHHHVSVGPPELLDKLPDRSLDLVVINSVTQYLSSEELDWLLRRVRGLLRGDGLLLVGDVLAPGVSGVTDAVALLRFSIAHGFLPAALAGLARTVLSDYLRLRTRLGLSRYGEPEMLKKLEDAGYSPHRAAANLGHNQARMTFLARPAEGGP